MKHKHGAVLTPKGTGKFTVWAPEKENVELVIKNSQPTVHLMVKDEMGYWTGEVKNIAAGTRYVFKLNGEVERPDPASLFQPDGVHGASAVVDVNSFNWTDESWQGLPLKEMIVYELHTGTFTDSGDFDGIISKLPYLAELGINTIEILPIAQFAGTRNWGYDGVYPFAVQNSYGGPQKLQQFVSEAHKAGFAVVLDVVYNHLGPEGNYFNDFGPYFTDKYKTPWGKAINFDDAWCDGVREYYLQNALMWLEEFHIDGLRLDAVHAIWDSGAHHFVQLLKEEVTKLENRTGRKKVLIAEFDLNNPRYTSPIGTGGYGLDGQWVDEFHHALHSVVTGETDGYYEDFGGLSLLEKSYRDSYVYTGEFSNHRKKIFGAKTNNPYSTFITFIQNHDQVGNRMLGERLTSLVSFESLKLSAFSYILSPHVPMLFMGEEYAEKNPFQYFISHTDKELVELVRKGRKEEFSYFKWQGEVPDPFDEETYNRSRLSWAHDKEQRSKQMFAYYKHLIAIRKEIPAITADDRNSLTVHSGIHENAIVLERKSGDLRVLLVMNFGKSQASVPNFLDRALTLISDSASIQWGGPSAESQNQVQPGEKIIAAPESGLAYTVN